MMLNALLILIQIVIKLIIKYLKIFSKEKKQTDNETSEKALNQFLENIRLKSLNPATQIFISGELDRVFANRVKVANIQNEYSNRLGEYYSDPIFITGLPRTGTTALQKMFSFFSRTNWSRFD